MASFVYDFKDIASRMKGELKAQAELVELLPTNDLDIICQSCFGSGYDKRKYWQATCPHCDGTGIEP